MSNLAKNKKTKKKTKISIARLFLFIIIVLVLGRVIYGFVIKHPKTEIVKYGNIELSLEAIGYLIKNETIIQSPATGTLEKLVEEGIRVKKGINVASIIKNNGASEYYDKVTKLDEEIKQIQLNIDNNNLFENDVIKIDSIIKLKLDEVSKIAISSNINNLSTIKSEINALLKKKMQITGKDGYAANTIKQKITTKENFSNQINLAKINIPTSISGIISYTIDGYESLLSPRSIDTLTPKNVSDFDNIINTNNNDIIIAGTPVIKLIDNFEWYIASVIDKAQIQPLEVGDNIYIQINEKKKLPAKVKNINTDKESNKVVIIFSLSNDLEQFYNDRKVNIKIIKRNYEGIKIPISSVIKKDSKTSGVLLIDRGITKFKEVDIIGYDSNSAIVISENELSTKKGLSIYNEIVVNPLKFNEGILVK